MTPDPRRLSALIETQTALAATGPDTAAILGTLALHVRQLTGADASLVELVGDRGLITRAASDGAVAQVGAELDADSLAGRAFHDRELVAWDDVDGGKVALPKTIGQEPRAAIASPLTTGDETLGVVTIVSAKAAALSVEDRDTVRRICLFAAHQLMQTRRLEDAERTSRLDPLTSLGNRRALDETLAAELARHARYGRTLSLCLVDLDGFKRINDTYGHAAGDRVLARVAEHLTSIRGADQAFRLGGDEFALVLPETGNAEAELVARRIAKRIREDSFPTEVNASWGVAQASGVDAAALLADADAKLYQRKRGETPQGQSQQQQQQAAG
jgi:diguanylate cyclase (GGDEF)-like protein